MGRRLPRAVVACDTLYWLPMALVYPTLSTPCASCFRHVHPFGDFNGLAALIAPDACLLVEKVHSCSCRNSLPRGSA